MRLRRDIHLYSVGQEFALIDPGANTECESYICPMNEAAALLWKTFQDKEIDEEAMADVLCDHYEVSHEVALRDIRQLLETWKSYGLLA